MKEFENLVTRSHKAGLKVIIDFVPNHVARQYGSDAKPKGVTDLGEKDDVTKAFSPNNNFYYIPDTKLEGNIDPVSYTHLRRKWNLFPLQTQTINAHHS